MPWRGGSTGRSAVAHPTDDDQTAGIVSRLLAAAVDAVVLLALLGLGYLGLTGIVFMIDPVRFRFPAPSRLVIVTSAFVVLVCYLAAGWTASGRTYGDHVLGLCVIDTGGRTPRAGRALVRAFLCAIFPVGLLWAALSRRRRSVQDLLVRTTVVYDWAPRLAPDLTRNTRSRGAGT